MKSIATGLIALVCVAGVSGEASGQTSAEEVAAAFVGAWTLESFEAFADDGTVTSRTMSGSIMYSDSGRMSAQLMPDGYESRPQPEDEPADRSGYVAYYGRFEIDAEAESVTHHVEGSILGQWVGRGLVRYYQVDGNTLELSLRNDTGRTTGTLTWRRNR